MNQLGKIIISTFLILGVSTCHKAKGQNYVYNNNNQVNIEYNWVNFENENNITISIYNSVINNCIAIGNKSYLSIKRYKNNLCINNFELHCDPNMTKLKFYNPILELSDFDNDGILELKVMIECMSCNLDEKNIILLIMDEKDIHEINFSADYLEPSMKYNVSETESEFYSLVPSQYRRYFENNDEYNVVSCFISRSE